MIKSKKQLKEWIQYEKKLYNIRFFDIITCNQMVYNWRYVKALRISEYYRNQKSKYSIPFFVLWRTKKNRIGKKVGIEIYENCFEKGLLIWHSGNIVVNSNARIGENCILHGDNCIGNDGRETCKAPKIGKNVDIGFGATIIGDIVLSDNITIGANSTVVKSCMETDSILVGTPAHIVNKR